MRLIDADVIIKALDDALDEAREAGEDLMDVLKMELFKNFMKLIIIHTPTIETEVTLERVKEYCRRRNLIIVTAEEFNDMKAIRNSLRKADDVADPKMYPCSVCPDYDRLSGCKSPGSCGKD